MHIEIPQHEIDEWRERRVTKDVAEDVRIELSNARAALDLACERSTDPAVREQHARVFAVEQMLRLLTG